MRADCKDTPPPHHASRRHPLAPRQLVMPPRSTRSLSPLAAAFSPHPEAVYAPGVCFRVRKAVEELTAQRELNTQVPMQAQRCGNHPLRPHHTTPHHTAPHHTCAHRR